MGYLARRGARTFAQPSKRPPHPPLCTRPASWGDDPGDGLAEVVLVALVGRYWRGELAQDVAAKFIGIRKESFVELADGYRFLDLMEDPHWWNYAHWFLWDCKWRNFVARFNGSFPECDERVVRRDTLPFRQGRDDDSSFRNVPDAPVTTFDESEAALLPAAQPHLNTPGEIGNDWRTRFKIEVGRQSLPGVESPRVLPRDNGQHLTDSDALLEIDLSGPEFDFHEAA